MNFTQNINCFPDKLLPRMPTGRGFNFSLEHITNPVTFALHIAK